MSLSHCCSRISLQCRYWLHCLSSASSLRWTLNRVMLGTHIEVYVNEQPKAVQMHFAEYLARHINDQPRNHLVVSLRHGVFTGRYSPAAARAAPVGAFDHRFIGFCLADTRDACGQLHWRTIWLRIPLWMPAIVLLLYPSGLFGSACYRHHRYVSRRRHRRCLRCGYSLVGNSSGRCPECGTSTDGSLHIFTK